MLHIHVKLPFKIVSLSYNLYSIQKDGAKARWGKKATYMTGLSVLGENVPITIS